MSIYLRYPSHGTQRSGPLNRDHSTRWWPEGDRRVRMLVRYTNIEEGDDREVEG